MNQDIMFAFLEQYKKKGQFVLHQNGNLGMACNSPKDCSGVYLVYAIKGNDRQLVYIGCSGMEENGKIKMRQDGLWGRLVKGKQFGKQRTQSWLSKIVELKLDSLLIKWWNTEKDFPEVVEFCALAEYYCQNNCFPKWNRECKLKNTLHEEFADYLEKNKDTLHSIIAFVSQAY